MISATSPLFLLTPFRSFGCDDPLGAFEYPTGKLKPYGVSGWVTQLSRHRERKWLVGAGEQEGVFDGSINGSFVSEGDTLAVMIGERKQTRAKKSDAATTPAPVGLNSVTQHSSESKSLLFPFLVFLCPFAICHLPPSLQRYLLAYPCLLLHTYNITY